MNILLLEQVLFIHIEYIWSYFLYLLDFIDLFGKNIILLEKMGLEKACYRNLTGDPIIEKTVLKILEYTFPVICPGVNKSKRWCQKPDLCRVDT